MIRTLILAALLGPGPGGPPEASPALLELQGQAVCRGSRLLLRDVAEIRTTDKELAESLAGLDLGLPPAEGWVRRLPAEQVREALREAGYSIERIQVAGAPESQVESRVVEIHQDQLVAAAELVLRAAAAALAAEEVEWSLSRPPRPFRAPAGRIGLDLTAKVRGGTLGRDEAVVDVAVRVDGLTFQTLPVVFRLCRRAEVLVTVAPVPAGRPLDQGAVTRRRMDLAGFYGTPLADPAGLAGKVAARHLPGGAILTALDLKDPELVRRGEAVTMVAARGGLTITMKGVAATGGSLGELIKVVNPGTQRVVVGRVAGVGIVELANSRGGER